MMELTLPSGKHYADKDVLEFMTDLAVEKSGNHDTAYVRTGYH
jgi:hypothetical protein